jgi:hypothetical protein
LNFLFLIKRSPTSFLLHPFKLLTVEFYNKRPKNKNCDSDRQVYHEMCHTRYKKPKIIWTLSSILCKRLQLISVKTHQMIQTHRYSLKYKKLNMQICQLWSVLNFFGQKLIRLIENLR